LKSSKVWDEPIDPSVERCLKRVKKIFGVFPLQGIFLSFDLLKYCHPIIDGHTLLGR
jgi:hypothetical protein